MILKRITELFSRPYVFAGTTILFILFMIFVLPDQSVKASTYTPAGGSFDTSFYYSPGSVYNKIEAYGEEGRRSYIINRWTFDLVFPIVYGLFILSAIAFSVRRMEWKILRSTRWICIPVFAVLFDLMENSFISLAMAFYPSQFAFLAFGASFSTILKWAFVNSGMILALLFPLLLGTKTFMKAFLSRKSSAK